MLSLSARSVVLYASGLLACLHNAPASAQVADRSLSDVAQAQSVNARVNSDRTPVGIPVGGAQLVMSANGKLIYDSNVYNTDTDVRADFQMIVQPHAEIKFKSDKDSISLSADASVERYASLGTENANQYELVAMGNWHVGQSVALNASGFVGRHHEMRGTIGDIVVGAPSQFDNRGGKVNADLQLGFFALSFGGGLETLRYLPVEFGGQEISESYRDRTTYNANMQASAPLSPGIRVFARGDWNAQDYRRFAGTLDQNSHGYALLSGLDFGLDELISGEFELGYLAQTYSDQALGTVSGLTYNGKLIWNPTPLLTATLTGGRSLQQSPFFAEGGVIEDNGSLQVDYWILRKLVISAAERVTFDNYVGVGRHDKRYSTNFEIRYFLDHRLELDLQFNHRDQQSVGVDARPYIGNSVMLSAVVKR